MTEAGRCAVFSGNGWLVKPDGLTWKQRNLLQLQRSTASAIVHLALPLQY